MQGCGWLRVSLAVKFGFSGRAWVSVRGGVGLRQGLQLGLGLGL